MGTHFPYFFRSAFGEETEVWVFGRVFVDREGKFVDWAEEETDFSLFLVFDDWKSLPSDFDIFNGLKKLNESWLRSITDGWVVQPQHSL